MKNALICFTRVPKPGVTKTRLLPILTGNQCALLHSAFLQDLSAVTAACVMIPRHVVRKCTTVCSMYCHRVMTLSFSPVRICP